MDPNGRQRRKRGNPVHGWVVLDKPLEMGSTRAVSVVRQLTRAQKVGHAGTLDPLAIYRLSIGLSGLNKTTLSLTHTAEINRAVIYRGPIIKPPRKAALQYQIRIGSKAVS